DSIRRIPRTHNNQRDLPSQASLLALTRDAARILGVARQLGSLATGKAAHLVVTDGDFQDAKTHVRYVFADGVRFTFDPPTQASGKPAETKKSATATNPEESKAPKAAEEAKVEHATEIETDRKPKLRTGGNVLIRGGTVLTVANGRLPQTDILVLNGKIAKIGKNLEALGDVKLLPAEGLYVLPGIIDTHCHFAVAGGGN